jgi:hypothetical protein
MRDLLVGFARRHDQEVEVQEISPTYLRLKMDGDGFGHHISIEQGPRDMFRDDTECGAQSSSCVRATVFAGGSIPDDELTENTVRQRRVAVALRETLSGECNP